jgi:hypothetical protein
VQITVKYAGTQYQLPTFGPADFVAFERQFGVSASAFQDEENARFEWLCFLVYRGLIRLEVVPRTQEFDENFLEDIDELEVDGEDDEAVDPDLDPTVPAAPLG